jgi:putative transposase
MERLGDKELARWSSSDAASAAAEHIPTQTCYLTDPACVGFYSFLRAQPASERIVEAETVGVLPSRLRRGTAPPTERTTMPGTYSQILYNIVFSTKHRQPWITPDLAERLYPYLGGIIRSEQGVLYDIGGIPDHVHLYLRWRTDESVSNLMRTVKACSSGWVHVTFPGLGPFAWQEGYSVFSVSKSQEGAVKKYIAGQAEHHQKEDFKTELLRMLRLHEIEFEERYVFD